MYGCVCLVTCVYQDSGFSIFVGFCEQIKINFIGGKEYGDFKEIE